MIASERTPWALDRSWTDPLTTLLALLVLFGSLAVLRQRTAPPPPATSVSLQGRMLELPLVAPRVLNLPAGTFNRSPDWSGACAKARTPWDRALVAVLAADQGHPEEGRACAQGGDPAFQKVFDFAYGSGPTPSNRERTLVEQGLRGTCGGGLLASRLAERGHGDPASLRRGALDLALRRLLLLGLLGLAAILLTLGGVATGLYLMVGARPPHPALPAWGLSGRALLLLLFGWYSVLLWSGSLVGPLVRALPPPLRPLGLPLSYGLHAAAGTALLLGMEGTSLAGLRRRCFGASPWGRSLAWALAYLSLGVAAVLGVGLVLSPWMKGGQPPQRELMEMLGASRSLGMTCLLFLTVAGLAPLFEEVLFRGLLLPWLAARVGRGWALAGTALLFGLIHLTPAGLPTLSTLGLVLGWAQLRTGNLRVPVLVHCAWNASVFLVARSWLGSGA